MQHKYGFGELDGIHRAVGTATGIFNELKHAGTAKAFEYLCRIVLIAGLRQGQRVTEKPPHVGWQGHQVLVAATDPFERFFAFRRGKIIYEQV